MVRLVSFKTRQGDAKSPRSRGPFCQPVVIAAIISAITSAIITIIVVMDDPPKVTIPSVVGEGEVTAMNKLDDRGIGPYVKERRYSVMPKGEVIEQDPVSGKMEPKPAVGLIVSKGQPPSPCVHPPIDTAPMAGGAEITVLEDGETVPEEVNPVQGTYRDLPPGSDIWLIVYSAHANLFWQQSHLGTGPALLLPGRRFRSAAWFGGTPGGNFEAIVVFAREGASRFLSETLHRWDRADNFAGLTEEELPAGLDEKDCVPVTRTG